MVGFIVGLIVGCGIGILLMALMEMAHEDSRERNKNGCN